VEAFNIITRELELFEGSGDETAAKLSIKPRIIVANKIDALDEPERLAKLQKYMAKLKVAVYPISAASGEGLPELLEALWKLVSAKPEPVKKTKSAAKKKPVAKKKPAAKKKPVAKKKPTARKKPVATKKKPAKKKARGAKKKAKR